MSLGGYRDDLGAALARLDQQDRELAELRPAAAERDQLRAEVGTLRAENISLRRSQYQLPRAQEVRLVVGVALAWLATFWLAASYVTPNGKPPVLELGAGPIAGLGALAAGFVIGFGRPHRLAALAILGTTSCFLVAKPWWAPVLWTWDGDTHAFNVNSETHYYFLVPGLIGLVITAIAASVKPAPPPKP